MPIVHRIHDLLEIRFKVILIRIRPGIDFVLDLLQLPDNIDRRLLVPCRRVLKVRKGALELYGLVPVCDETGRNCGNEGNTCETFVRICCGEDLIACRKSAHTSGSVCFLIKTRLHSPRR